MLIQRRGLPALVIAFLGALAASASAQFEERRGDLSEAVSLELADSAALGHLKRISEYLNDKQWENAVGTLRRVMEEYGDGLVRLDHLADRKIGLTTGRYVSIRQYCQLRLSALPPEALALYRGQVDDLARRLFEKAAKSRDRRGLQDVIDNFFCSSVGDDALLRLGDLALEEGDYAAARDHWSRVTPVEAPGNFDVIRKDLFERVRKSAGLSAEEASLLDELYELKPPIGKKDVPDYALKNTRPLARDAERRLARLWTWHGLVNELKYPDMRLETGDEADVDARLVLASIMSGDEEQAQQELSRFAHLHPDAQGMLAGRRVHLSSALTSLLRESRDWPLSVSATDWPTFAGAADRNGMLPGEIDIRGPSWTVELPKVAAPDVTSAAKYGYRGRRVAEGEKELLSYHPVIVGDRVFLADEGRVFAFGLKDGKPLWPTARHPTSGVIFPVGESSVPSSSRQGYLGAPRFTLTVHSDKLFVRIGSPITSSVDGFTTHKPTSSIFCLDLASQGRVVWEAKAADEWSFEGPPVTDGQRVYVALRRRGAAARTNVACYDAESGRPLWQRFVCGAETPARGQVDEVTHNLLTLHQDTLYYNTNLGAVAALSVQDGSIKWLTTYTRAKAESNQKPAYFYRDLTPCLYHDGLLYVAPSDHAGILCVVAATGQIVLSALEYESDTAVHLLGIRGDYLLAGGDKLWWIDIKDAQFRSGGKSVAEVDLPLAYGRGLVVGNQVCVPTRDELLIYRANAPPTKERPIPERAIPLGPRKAGGGNLVACDTHLLIVGADVMYGFEFSQSLSSYRSGEKIAPRKADLKPGQSPAQEPTAKPAAP
jgi:outer membrane protein assembly factor BamB